MTEGATAPAPDLAEQEHHPGLPRLTLIALGVVYGDIGTSPLYALRECFHGPHAVAVDEANVLGVLSLIFWSLVLVISVKYLIFVLRADNQGEGGILALMALLLPGRGSASRGRRWLVVMLGLFGAALLYGDGMITPAISVLSAVEGLNVATPVFEPYIIPITIAVLIGLFLLQSRGTSGVGILFGPVTLVWFITLSVLGVIGIWSNPHVLAAVYPGYAWDFFVQNGWYGYLVLGSVFLVVTGGEAIYADMGHFGAPPIRIGWFALVFPALLLNYFGQGAHLLAHPEVAENTFFALSPKWMLYPLVFLATFATVIASQAVISAVFSVTMQTVQLGYMPRVAIDHTSPSHAGQIYIAPANWLLLASTIGLVLGFRSSSGLAAAYGIAVTTTMVITTLLLYLVIRERWRWPLWTAVPFIGFFLLIDLAFFGANVLKIPAGGWFPLVVGGALFTLATTWNRGREILAERLGQRIVPLEGLISNLRDHPPHRVSGAAVFMTGNPSGTPSALLHNLKHNQVLHEQIVLLTLVTEKVAHVPLAERLEVEKLPLNFYRVTAHYGFMEDPHVPRLIERCAELGLNMDLARTTFFLGRETLISTEKPGMARWRERLFAMMSKNAQPATAFFQIPADRVVELGVQIEL